MQVELHSVTKAYGREVIFSGVDRTISAGSRTAILGPNGSGKSTFLQLIGGALSPTGGSVEHRHAGKKLPEDEVYRHVSIASPYMGLYEDLELSRTIEIHMRFKPLKQGVGRSDLARIAYLEHALEKPVAQFSSGMKQRLKLALAILSETPLLLLDEPASNLDAEAIAWYRELFAAHAGDRTVLIASNHIAHEHDMCGHSIEMETLKGR